MLFTDIVFIPFLFITFACMAVFGARQRIQLMVLLAASYIFYGWWDVRFLALIIFSSLLDFAIGKLIYGSKSKKKDNFICLLVY